MHLSITLERFAAVQARLDDGAALGEVLAAESLTEEAWRNAQQGWLARIGAEAERNRYGLAQRYQRAYLEASSGLLTVQARDHDPAPVEPTEEPAPQDWLDRTTSATALDLGLDEALPFEAGEGAATPPASIAHAIQEDSAAADESLASLDVDSTARIRLDQLDLGAALPFPSAPGAEDPAPGTQAKTARKPSDSPLQAEIEPAGAILDDTAPVDQDALEKSLKRASALPFGKPPVNGARPPPPEPPTDAPATVEGDHGELASVDATLTSVAAVSAPLPFVAPEPGARPPPVGPEQSEPCADAGETAFIQVPMPSGASPFESRREGKDGPQPERAEILPTHGDHAQSAQELSRLSIEQLAAVAVELQCSENNAQGVLRRFGLGHTDKREVLAEIERRHEENPATRGELLEACIAYSSQRSKPKGT